MTISDNPINQPNPNIYTMDVEYPVNVVKQHGFHLGTIHHFAEQIVLERLPYAVSIALRRGGKLVKIYDFRDLEGKLS